VLACGNLTPHVVFKIHLIFAFLGCCYNAGWLFASTSWPTDGIFNIGQSGIVQFLFTATPPFSKYVLFIYINKHLARSRFILCIPVFVDCGDDACRMFAGTSWPTDGVPDGGRNVILHFIFTAPPPFFTCSLFMFISFNSFAFFL